MTATDALDNPSYFALAGAAHGAHGAHGAHRAHGAHGDSHGHPPAEPPPPAVPAAPAPPTKPLLPLLKRRPRGAGGGPRAVSQGCPGGTSSRRLGFRWLLKSMSGSSTSLQQIALGQPRPGDVAPPSPTSEMLGSIDVPGPLASPGPVVSPGRLRDSHGVKPHGKGPASSGTFPRSATRAVATQALATQAPAQYYNVELRRHSVGSLMHSSRARTSGHSAPSGPSGRNVPDDIVIVWSGGGGGSAASLWISYLQSCFVEICRKRGRPSFRTSDVSVDELAGDGAERWRTRLEQAKLVVVVVCPALLARVSSCTAVLAGPMARLDSDRALLMLLGVHEYELQPEHRAVLGGDCKRMAVRDQDATFVGEFLAVAMDILVRAWRARAARERGTTDGAAMFSLAPKKVKQGMNKVLVLLVSPLQAGDDVHVTVHTVHKPDGPVSVPSRSRNPYTVQFLVPESFLDVSAMVSVTVTVNGQSLGSRQLKCESRLRELDRILRAQDNPLQFLCQTLGFGPSDREALDNSLLCNYMRNLPPHFNLLHSQGGRPSYSCEQYPTLLHFAAHLGLERFAMALLEGPGGEQACYIRNCDDFTPAELSERAGYSRLACALQGYMQMSELSNVYSILKNMSDGEREAGMSSFTSCEEPGNYLSPRPASETYSVPPPPAPVTAPLGMAPTIPEAAPAPGAAPSTDNAPGDSAPPPASPPASPRTSPRDSYVDMAGDRGGRKQRHIDMSELYENMPEFGSPPALPESPTAGRRQGIDLPDEAEEAAADAAVYQDIDEPDGVPVAREGSVEGSSSAEGSAEGEGCRRGSDPASEPAPDSAPDAAPDPVEEDDDLMEIIRDLRSSSFSLGEVEHLVQSWRGRNATHQSFKDKQEQLARMREELERVERRLGAGSSNAGRPSPLERIKRVFTKARLGKNKAKGGRAEPESAATARAAGGSTPAATAPRPPSSLSRRSSSSSTWSGRSSDASERQVQVDEVSWLHPVSPASEEHYVSPLGVRPVHGAFNGALPGSPPGFAPAAAPAPAAGSLALAEDGFPLDSSGFCSYVNVSLPSWPPPVPARPTTASPVPE